MPRNRTIALMLILLGGCDRLYGVQARTTFTKSVDVHCVGVAVESVPNVGNVEYHRSESRAIELLPKQREVRTISHVWLYGEGGKSILQLNNTPDGWDFTNARTRMGSPIPRSELARFEPLMRSVNSAVAERCRLPLANIKLQWL